VVEKVFAPQPFKEKAWGARAGLIGGALHSDQRYLLKIHGDVLDASDRVLTLSDYKRHYGNNSIDGVDLSLALPDVLKTAFTARTLLFLGCSLSIDRTVRLLRRVISPSSPTHYAIVEQPSDKGVAIERARFLSDHKIRPLWYPEGQFGAIELFVEALAKRAQNLSTTASRRSAFVTVLLLIPAILGGLIFAGPWIQPVLSMWQVVPWMQGVSLFLVGLSLAGIAMHHRWQQGPGIPLERLKLSPSIANGIFGGLLGGTIAAIVVAYAYYNLPGADPSITSPPAIILYCVLSSVVLGAAIQLFIIACIRSTSTAAAPILVNEVTGGLLGGGLGGVPCGIAGGWYFGQLPQPSVTPGIVMIGAITGAIAIAGGYLFFNYVGSLKRAVRVAVVATIVAGLCGVMGIVGLGYQNPADLFSTLDVVELAYAGAIVGAMAGAIMGLQVGLTLLFYRLWDESGV
jgi:hypothetical protein